MFTSSATQTDLFLDFASHTGKSNHLTISQPTVDTNILKNIYRPHLQAASSTYGLDLTNDELELRFTKLVQTERKITHLVLECIAEIDSRKLYLERAYQSLFDYLVRGFGYSPSAAVRRIDSARLLREIPEVSEQIEAGALNLSQLSQIQRAVRATEKVQSRKIPISEKISILHKIEFASQECTERVLSQELVLPIPTDETEQNHCDESVTLTVTFTKEQIDLLEQARNAISHCVPSYRWAETLTHLAKRELVRSHRISK